MTSRDGRFAGQVAIVTGGGSGIGLAAARRLAAEGAAVAVWDLDPEAARQALPGPAGRAAFSAVDVRDAAAIGRAAEDARTALGPADILVNAAGVTRGFLDALALGPSDWARILDTNALGALLSVQAVVPGMAARGRGRVVGVSSVLAAAPVPGQTAYAASKSALEAMTRVWAREFGPSGVTVNAVRPGYIDTPMNAANGPEVLRHVLSRTPLGRIGTPDEVAHAILFLASEEAAFITGAVLAVDGGFVP
ncbi:MAG TPA: glucose 1-dehydrogenase [Thermoanaerobaculia bacterium]|nr:glucose 1-dehydrogenase [Thermoanaerobaculia bacterium]